jgi:hypothetical protein
LRTLPTHLTQRGGTEWPAAVRPAESRISNRSRRARRATPSSSRRSRSAAVSAARYASLRPARPRRGDPAGPRRMAPAYARTPRRRGACGLARWPQCSLSARRTDDRRAPRGRRRITRAKGAGLDLYQHAVTLPIPHACHRHSPHRLPCPAASPHASAFAIPCRAPVNRRVLRGSRLGRSPTARVRSALRLQ